MSRAGRRGVVAIAVAALLGGAAAVVLTRGDDTESGSDSTSPSATWPLLGTPGEATDRPALGVKIDDTDRGRPQAGLRAADVVFEEVVEGGLTRLLAVYHSTDPAAVGPVRSARSTDISLLAELGRPLFAWSGANPTFGAAVAAADLVDVGFSAVPDAYRREPGRAAPYNLFATPDELRSAGDDDGTPPPALFTYRADGEELTGPELRTVTGYQASTAATAVEWTWDAEARAWLRTQNGTPHVDADGDRVAATNVVVRTTEYRDSGVRDSRGAVVPEAVTAGEGDAWLLADGHALPARWQKSDDDAPTVFTDLDGAPLRLTPGSTWVEVLPPGTGDVVG